MEKSVLQNVFKGFRRNQGSWELRDQSPEYTGCSGVSSTTNTTVPLETFANSPVEGCRLRSCAESCQQLEGLLPTQLTIECGLVYLVMRDHPGALAH